MKRLFIIPVSRKADNVSQDGTGSADTNENTREWLSTSINEQAFNASFAPAIPACIQHFYVTILCQWIIQHCKYRCVVFDTIVLYGYLVVKIFVIYFKIIVHASTLFCWFCVIRR